MEPQIWLLSCFKRMAFSGEANSGPTAQPSHFSQNPSNWVTPQVLPTPILMGRLPQCFSRPVPTGFLSMNSATESSLAFLRDPNIVPVFFSFSCTSPGQTEFSQNNTASKNSQRHCLRPCKNKTLKRRKKFFTAKRFPKTGSFTLFPQFSFQER